MNVIELRNIGKTFTDRAEPTIALRDVNLTIAPGEFVAIIGPSGSGKSTLMNLLGLLDFPSEGQYLLDGEVVSSFRDRKLAKLRRSKIGFVFQSFNLLPRLSVIANVELPMIYAGMRARARRERALELLGLVGLADHAGYRPNQISGGQTQRVAIARALANQPSLILADEPTGNLDTKASDAIIGELRRLNRETGATIVIVTHNPEIAGATDRTITVRDGRIVSDQANGAHAARAPEAAVNTGDTAANVATEAGRIEQADAGYDTGHSEETESVHQREIRPAGVARRPRHPRAIAGDITPRHPHTTGSEATHHEEDAS